MENTAINTTGALAAQLRFTADASELARAAKFLAGKLIERRNTLPILSYLHLAGEIDGTLTLTGTNLDLLASITLAADIQAPGSICIDAAIFADAMAKAIKAQFSSGVQFVASDGRVKLSAGRAAFTVPSLPADDFPMLTPTGEGEESVTLDLPASMIFSDLVSLAPCMSKDENRYYMRGVAVQERDGALCLVATDGGNMGIARRGFATAIPTFADAILPAVAVLALNAWSKGKAADGERVELTIGNGFTIRAGALTLRSKAIDGTFVQWEQLADRVPAPTGEVQAVMFPELLPGAPTGAIETIGKACAKATGKAIDWRAAGDLFAGTLPADAGLTFICMAGNPEYAGRKGFAFHLAGRGEAERYLLALVEARGLPNESEMRARCAAINAEYGEPDSAAFNGKRAYGHAEAQAPALRIGAGGRVLGVTFTANHKRAGWTETRQNWQTLAIETVEHAPIVEAVEGAYSILMPADGPAQLTATGIGEVVGPDGVTYQIAADDHYDPRKIHLSAAQLGALMDCPESWDVIEFPAADGKPRFVNRDQWLAGDLVLTARQADGRVWPSKWCKVTARAIEHCQHETFTRAEIEARLAGEVPAAPIVEVEAPAAIVEAPASQPVSAEAEPEGPEMAAEPVEALATPEIAPEPAIETPADAEPDALAAIIARLDAVEAALAALPAESANLPAPSIPEIIPAAPSEAIAPKRSAAHERAIRRAWSERKAARGARFMIQLRTDQHANANHRAEYFRGLAEGETNRANDNDRKRRRAVIAARRMITAQRAEHAASITRMAAQTRQSVDTARAELASVKRALADPMQPERESDLARLVIERDQARAANGALQSRAERAETALAENTAKMGLLARRIGLAERQLNRASA